MTEIVAKRLRTSGLDKYDHILASVEFVLDNHVEQFQENIHPFKLARNKDLRDLVRGELVIVSLTPEMIEEILTRYRGAINRLTASVKKNLRGWMATIRRHSDYLQKMTARQKSNFHMYQLGKFLPRLTYNSSCVSWSPSNKGIRSHVRSILDLLEHAPRIKRPLRVFRGVSVNIDQTIQTLTFPYLTATSLMAPVAVFFSEGYTVFDITVPVDLPCFFLMNAYDGHHPSDQFEVVLPPCNFKILEQKTVSTWKLFQSVEQTKFAQYFFDNIDEEIHETVTLIRGTCVPGSISVKHDRVCVV